MTTSQPVKTEKREFFTKKWRDLPLATKGIFLNAVPLLVLLASLAFIFESEQQAALLEARVEKALQIQQDIQALHTQLLEATTGVRDFLLTGNPEFLTVYYRAKERLPALLSTLDRMIEDEKQKVYLKQVKGLVDQSIADLTELASNTQSEADERMLRKFSSQSNTLNQLRKQLTAMGQRESALIERDRKRVIAQRQRYNRITLGAVIAGVLGSLIGVWVFSNTIVARVRTIRDSAAHLAKGEPLSLPDISQDELGQLTEELDHASQLLAQSTQEAHHARVEAEEASAAKSMFLSRTSHELRTPLNAILGFAQILENDLPDGRQKDSAVLIHNAGQHLLKLINEVLDIARIESRDLEVSLTPLMLNALLLEATHYIKPLGQVRGIDILTEFEPDLAVKADAQKLLQVLLNLLSNALKYGPSNANVSFKAFKTPSINEQSHERVIIQVLDQGPGIPAHMRSRLFTPFDRLGAEQTVTEGTGLGLVLSKQLVEAMGGSIEVDDKQSLFSVSLPALPNSAVELTNKNESSEVPVSPQTALAFAKRWELLYIEDQASNRALLEAIIQRHKPFKLHCVSSIKEALTYLNHKTPDIIILDLNLPDGSGESFIPYLQNNPHTTQTPILVLSADAMPTTIARVSQLGVTYFTKPLDIAAFNQHLAKLTSANLSLAQSTKEQAS